MTNQAQVASIIMAAGRGSRMKYYQGNKTLLPLVPGPSPFQGSRPFIHNILENLPEGPKCIVVHHGKEQVMEATRHFNISYCEQQILNGTGGALLACTPFIKEMKASPTLITMGDVPLVRRQTYVSLLAKLKSYNMVVLGFCPAHKRQYGLLDIKGGLVRRVIEWKYWKDMPAKRQKNLTVCNAGIYAIRGEDLMEHLDDLAQRGHEVQKEICGEQKIFEEYFLTDLVEILAGNGKSVGYSLVDDPDEVMGVDDPEALAKAQELYASGKYGSR